MKRFLFNLLIGLLTFFIGTFIQNTAKCTHTSSVNPLIQEQKTIETSNISYYVEETVGKPEPEIANNADELYGSGWYLVDNFKGMREVWTILLSQDYKDSSNNELIWSATILTDNESDNFESVWIKTDNSKLSFKTKRNKSVKYQFDGVFFKGRKLGSNGEKLLRGSLRKFVKGKEVAKIKADFAYHEPRCWH